MTKRQENSLYILFVTAILAIIVTNTDYVDMMVRIWLVFICLALTVEREYGSELSYIEMNVLIFLLFLSKDGYVYSICINENLIREYIDWFSFVSYVVIISCLCLWCRRPQGANNKWLLFATAGLIWTKIDNLIYAIRRCLLNAELYIHVSRKIVQVIVDVVIYLYPMIMLFLYEKNRKNNHENIEERLENV